jgi:hypothetical protein
MDVKWYFSVKISPADRDFHRAFYFLFPSAFEMGFLELK